MEWRGPLTLEWCLSFPCALTARRWYSATLPSHHLWGFPQELRLYPLFLPRSSHPQRDSLATSSTEVQLPHFGSDFISNLMSSVRLAACLSLRTCSHSLMWSAPSHGRLLLQQTVSPHPIPSQAPAPLPSPSLPLPVLAHSGFHL